MADEVTIRETHESDWPILFENQRDPASSAMAGVPAREWDAYIALQRRSAQTRQDFIRPSSTMGRSRVIS